MGKATTKPQECLIAIYPEHGICKREVRLSATGKPVKCGDVALARIENGPPLCKKHLIEMMKVSEKST